jgi:hypothetical protein
LWEHACGVALALLAYAHGGKKTGAFAERDVQKRRLLLVFSALVALNARSLFKQRLEESLFEPDSLQPNLLLEGQLQLGFQQPIVWLMHGFVKPLQVLEWLDDELTKRFPMCSLHIRAARIDRSTGTLAWLQSILQKDDA